ncbi:hypothetical protein IW140_001559 [Coemansia sp. RSA 1813]|nr:hypothetical protein IW138_002048 [Coemansia sp. RSA 986]KAJ2216540.1 hypothetical protein EV179_001335 [Coemansia sp. RSA 487]KAJ2571379.1 hypothetical protein IW140_001559 [Coemansia sp. RSA 1813]
MRSVNAGLIWVPLILAGMQALAGMDSSTATAVKAAEYQQSTQHGYSSSLSSCSGSSGTQMYGDGVEVLLSASQLLESVGSLVEPESETNAYSVERQGDFSRNSENSNAGGDEDVTTPKAIYLEEKREPKCAPTTTSEEDDDGEEEEEEDSDDGKYEYEERPTTIADNLNAAIVEELPTETSTLDDPRAQPTRTTPSAADLHQRDPKSLKGRFNYASADCAAVVLKANKEAKGLTAILNPKKDQYMLNECSAAGKFVIVELCDDILIDTIVLGNYEFFSSTFKDAMVYVSDRYPPKNKTWTPLSHFQARNNRDAQVFPVHDPPIWAKYIKVDFLSHYGNEHYCPLTMFKVYGTTQMEQYRKEEDEEDFADTATLTVDALVGSPLRDYQLNFPYQYPHQQHQQLRIGGAAGSPAKAFLRDMQGLVNRYEEREDNEPQEPVRHNPTIPKVPNLPWDRQEGANNSNINARDNDDDEYEEEDDDDDEAEEEEEEEDIEEAGGSGGGNIKVALDTDKHSPDMRDGLPQGESGDGADKANADKKANGGPVPPIQPHKQRGQESIFKTIMRRLLRVERNVTLAYRYLEEQHMVFNLVLQQVELNNLENVQLAIKQLNHTTAKQMQSLTTLSEEIWRAILYDLEEYQQKTQSEMSEMSSRLEFLAEEVLFEKRMNVAQLALLLIIVVMIAASKVVTKLALIPESKKEK